MRLLASLLITASLLGAALCIGLGILFWPTYIHRFTPYLKWQDALLATLWYGAFILLAASVIVTRFLLALRSGRRHGMLILHVDRPDPVHPLHPAHSTLTVRDLSPKNFSSVYGLLRAAFACFLAALLGLAPDILIGWTLHLPHPALIVLASALSLILSLAGLVLTLVSASFIIIGIIGSVSFIRKLGAPHTYQLSNQTTLRIDGLHSPILTVSCPRLPETLFDLNLLHIQDQQRLLQLLRAHRLDAHLLPPNLFDQDIDAALQQSFQHSAVPV